MVEGVMKTERFVKTELSLMSVSLLEKSMTLIIDKGLAKKFLPGLYI